MLIKNHKKNTEKYKCYSNDYKEILDNWNEIKCDTGFKEK
jgi:hypothetical protein